MYFYSQTPELLSGKAFNDISDILHFDVRNVSYLIFDDTVINNKLGYNIELTRRQYSGNEIKLFAFYQQRSSWVLE